MCTTDNMISSSQLLQTQDEAGRQVQPALKKQGLGDQDFPTCSEMIRNGVHCNIMDSMQPANREDVSLTPSESSCVRICARVPQRRVYSRQRPLQRYDGGQRISARKSKKISSFVTAVRSDQLTQILRSVHFQSKMKRKRNQLHYILVLFLVAISHANKSNPR